MNAWFPPLRAKAVLTFSLALVVAGLVPVLYCVGLVVWQAAALFQAGSWVPLPASVLFTDHPFAFIPKFPWAGLVFALAGLGMAAAGVTIAFRQHAAIRAERQRRDDRLRRVRDYARDDGQAAPLDGRREPFISDQLRSRVRFSERA